MSFVENLKNRSLDRKIFLIGAFVAFIGCLLPMISFPTDFLGLGEIGAKNVFGAAAVLNYAEPDAGYAFNATFIIIVWLMSIAAIASFVFSANFVVDVLVWLIGAGFGIASMITLPSFVEVSMFSYMSVGSYIIFVGWTVALVGWVLSAIHVQQQGIRKEI